MWCWKYSFFIWKNEFDFEEDEEFVDGNPDDFPGYRDFYELFCKFYDKINFDSDNIVDVLSDYEGYETDCDYEGYETDSD